MHAVVTGNPVDGIEIVGPFHECKAANEYGDRLSGEWWVTQLQSPCGLEPLERDDFLDPGRYSLFVLKDDQTWEQPTFETKQRMAEHDFRMNAEMNCGGFYSCGVQEDNETPDDCVRRF